MNQKRIITIAAIIIGVSIIGLIVYSLIPKATIRLSVAPEEFTVSINGVTRTAKTGDTINIAPGEVEITISREEFGSYTENFTVKNGEDKEILAALEAETDAARALLNSTKSQIIIQRIGGKKVEEGAKSLTDENPILKELPIKDRFYTIIVCNSERYPDDKKKFAICIRLFDLAAKQSAIDDLAARGYGIDDYEFIFVDLSYKNIQEQGGE